MKKTQVIVHMFLAAVLSFVFNTASSEPANLHLLRKEVKVYHDSGAYQKELAQIITQVRHFMLSKVNSNTLLTHPKKLAVVLDIDETSLSNYHSLASHRFAPSRKQLQRDIESATAPAIQPTLSFYDDALKHGVSVFFVTGRKESDRLITDKNLKQAGFHDWSGLYLKPEDYNQSSVVPFKARIRETITKLGYTIIASIGDQESDLKGGYAEKTFKLPNPYYYIP